MPASRSSRVVPDGPEHRLPRGSHSAPEDLVPVSYDVELPGGGTLTLGASDEVTMWNDTRDRYIREFKLTKQNDLMALGAILSMNLQRYRAQKELGDAKKAAAALAMVRECTKGIMESEKALGIDKAAREKGGQHTVSDYITRLKRAAYMKGVHLSERLKAYEAFNMEMRWKLRLLRNGDAEDKAYHGLTEKSICAWAETELAKIEEADKTWAKEKGALWVGKL